MLPGAVCLQYRRSGATLRPYHYRFWREDGQLRKQYVRLADVESVRAACQTHRGLQTHLRAGRAEYKRTLARARELLRMLSS